MKKYGGKLTQKAVAANGIACYIRKSTAGGDVNTFQDDVAEGINCVNPISGYTGDVPGSDGK